LSVREKTFGIVEPVLRKLNGKTVVGRFVHTRNKALDKLLCEHFEVAELSDFVQVEFLHRFFVLFAVEIPPCSRSLNTDSCL
jgi:hypothetical protein